MPCLDEAGTVGTCVAKARGYLERRDVDGEVLVVDNGSTDGSPRVARAHGARVVIEPRRGYGHALRTGIREARGRYVVMGDADDSYDFTDLDPFLEKLRAGFDLVMGNRFAGGIEPGAMPALHRLLGNPVLSFLGRLFFRCPVGDFHCGLRGVRRDRIRELGLTAGGMELASEMVVKATLRGLAITEVPTTLSPDGRRGGTHLRTWRDGWRHLRFLLLFSPRWLFLYPGILALVGGVACMLWLLKGPRGVGGVMLDVNTLVYGAAATVIGLQLVSFAGFTRAFAVAAGLLPEPPQDRRLGIPVRLEVGLGVGATLVVAGLAASAYSLMFWGRTGFGVLDPAVSLRIVVPAATAVILGIQVASASFVTSVLSLAPGPGLRRPPVGGDGVESLAG